MENNSEIILFKSRYGDEYSLTKINEDLYKAQLGEYCRVGFADKNCTIIDFVDPSGGPFIQVGKVFPYNGRIVKGITSDKEKGILIEFKG